jgi:uncharacterized protein YbjT (DUF2867 family)
MRIFLAGATGVIGIRLVPILLENGHQVVGMTRSVDKVEQLRRLGAEPVVCDVFDAPRLARAVADFAPQMLIHQLTDLPDAVSQIDAYRARNERIRLEGTRNLLAAARAASVSRLLAQSIAWRPPSGSAGLDEFEHMVLEAGGVIVRYGQFYGPGTYYEDRLPDPPRVQIDAAARATLELLAAPAGVVVVTDET